MLVRTMVGMALRPLWHLAAWIVWHARGSRCSRTSRAQAADECLRAPFWHSYTQSAMPIYEYRCERGHTFEVHAAHDRGPAHRLPEHGTPVPARLPPGRGPLQGLGLLQHRLRQEEGAAGGRVLRGASSESVLGSSEVGRQSDSSGSAGSKKTELRRARPDRRGQSSPQAHSSMPSAAAAASRPPRASARRPASSPSDTNRLLRGSTWTRAPRSRRTLPVAMSAKSPISSNPFMSLRSAGARASSPTAAGRTCWAT